MTSVAILPVPTAAGEVAPDTFFDQTKQRRLAGLMARWRAARDSGATLPAEEQAELDALIVEELHASEKRTAACLRNLAQ